MKKFILTLLVATALVGAPAAADSITDLAIATPELSILVEAVVKADLAGTLAEAGPFTVFAPTNDAFMAAGIDPAAVDADTLRGVLFDHVLPGAFPKRYLRTAGFAGQRLTTAGGLELGVDRQPLAVNGANVIAGPIEADNGLVYVVDAVLLRPAPSIVDRAVAAPFLSTLVQAASNAGLVETLANDGPWTVFAPTDAAFAALGIDVDAIDDVTLAGVLLDHVVRGEFTARELFSLGRTGGSLRTMGGLELDFRGYLKVNGNRVVGANVSAANGIVHVIDGVLLRGADGGGDGDDDDSSDDESSDDASDDDRSNVYQSRTRSAFAR